MMKRLLSFPAILMAGALFAVSCTQAPNDAGPGAATNASAITLYLVRHAETQDGKDPALTEAGTARAEALADRLEGAGIEAVWSTDYRRTLATAAPLAERLDVEVRIYDPGDLPAFAEMLWADGATALVVGHSNTTPQLAEALGGDDGAPIVEAIEYDRLYVLSRTGNDGVESEIQRYGEASGADGP